MIQTAPNNDGQVQGNYPGTQLLIKICQLLSERGISVNDPNLVLPTEAKRDFSHLYNEAHRNINPNNRSERGEESLTSNRIEPASTLSDRQLYKWALRVTHNLNRVAYIDVVIENNGGPKTFTRLEATKSQLEAPADNTNSAQVLDQPRNLEQTLDMPADVKAEAIQGPNSTTQELALPQRTPANLDETAELPNGKSQDFDLTTFSMSQNANANQATTIEIGGSDWNLADPSFSSQFTNLVRIGQGGFGKVYKAQNFTGNTVAIKFLTNPADEKKFITEARIADQLGNHDACVKIHSSGKVRVAHKDGRELFLPYISMEQLNPEGTLQAYIERQNGKVLQDRKGYKKYLESAIKSFALTICEGISYAHKKGIVHRDLKPENICETVHGKARVIDWGMAYISKGATLTNVDSRSETTNGGTLAFMPPEQFAQVISPQTDVYAIGAILYNIATLTRPTNLSKVPESVKKKLIPLYEEYKKYWRDILVPEASNPDEKSRISIDPAESIAKFLPDALKLIIKKAMSPLPENRYNTVAELKSDLENFMTGNITIAEKEAYGTFGGCQRWLKLLVKRNSIGIRITAGVAVVAGIVAAWWADSSASNRQSKHARENLSGVVAKFDGDLDWKKDADQMSNELSEVLATHRVYAEDPIAGEVYSEVKERKEDVVDSFRAERDRKISEYKAFLKDADEVIASANNRDKPLTLTDDPVVAKLKNLLKTYDSENPEWLSNLEPDIYGESEKAKLKEKVNDVLAMLANRLLPIFTGMNEPSAEQLPDNRRQEQVRTAKEYVNILARNSDGNSFAVSWLTEACDAIALGKKPPVVTDEQIPLLKTDADFFLAAVSSMDFDTHERDVTFEEMKKAFDLLDRGLELNPKSFSSHLAFAEVAQYTRTNEEGGLKHAVQAMELAPSSNIAFLSYVNLTINVAIRNKDIYSRILLVDEINERLSKLINDEDLSVSKNASFALYNLNRSLVLELNKAKQENLTEKYKAFISESLKRLEQINLQELDLARELHCKFQYYFLINNFTESLNMLSELREMYKSGNKSVLLYYSASLVSTSARYHNDNNIQSRDEILNEVLGIYRNTENVNYFMAKQYLNDAPFLALYENMKSEYILVGKSLKAKYPHIRSTLAPELQ